MTKSNSILKGTIVLTFTGLLTRIMGFFYRIFLSQLFGAEGIGIYQLIFPVYAIGFSLTSAGIELSLSRCISKHSTLQNKTRCLHLLISATSLSLLFSIITTLLLQKNAQFIAVHILQAPEVSVLLILLSYVFPFASIHSCIVGYYLGIKNTKLPALSQFFEQTFRICSVFIFYKLSFYMNFKYNISFAVIGILIGEIFSSFYCVYFLTGNAFPIKIPHISLQNFLICSKELLTISLPVTFNRILVNLLQSIEAVSIPLSLQRFGLSSSDSLSIYGTLTGMAFPCILFPSAITNALSTMLLPAIAEVHTSNNKKSLKSLTKKTIISCTLLGSMCCIVFTIFGNLAGNLLFNSPLAGKFIITLAWICPFLYTNTALISIINGLGKTSVSLSINVISLFIRILSVNILIPDYGIWGYLTGLLSSQIIIYLLGFIYLHKQFKAEVS